MKKTLKKTLKKIQARFVRTTVLNETVINNMPYRVVEKTSVLPWYRNSRALCFKTPDEPNKVYIHSRIFHSKKAHYQPALVVPQKVIELWHNLFNPKRALVLGAAGCTLPRFIALNFPEMQTVGIEYCPEFIELAKKYFFISQISGRFSLVQGDAFDYVINKKIPEKQDVIFVDIFNKSSIPDELFSEEFMNGLYEETNPDSLIVFNLLTLNRDDAAEFAKGITPPFNKKALILNSNSLMLILVKSTDGEKLNTFFEGIHIFDSVIEI